MDQETMFQGTACTLEQVLQSRTDRQDRQQALLKKGCSCLLSFGLNVPGAVKQSPALRQVFDEGLSQLRQLLSGALGEESVRHSVTGQRGADGGPPARGGREAEDGDAGGAAPPGPPV